MDTYTFTKHISDKIEYWNPFDERKDINFFENKKVYYILGPLNNDNIQFLWKFNINYNNGELTLGTTENSKNLDSCIVISIKNNIAKINYLNNCKNHKGYELMKWNIEIIKKLGCTKCILIDNAEKKCNNRKYKNYVPLSLIHKLWRNKTYYEIFDFIPYNKNNNSYKYNKSIELDEYIEKLKSIAWSSFNINDNNEWTEFLSRYASLYDSPYMAFEQFTPDDCSIFYDVLFLLDNPSQDGFEILQNIKNIITKSVWMKLL